MDDIYSIIQKSLKKKGLKPKTDAVNYLHAIDVWLQSKPDIIAKHCRALTFDTVHLYIETDHAIAAQEMQALIPALQEYALTELQLTIEKVILKRK